MHARNAAGEGGGGARQLQTLWADAMFCPPVIQFICQHHAPTRAQERTTVSKYSTHTSADKCSVGHAHPRVIPYPGHKSVKPTHYLCGVSIPARFSFPEANRLWGLKTLHSFLFVLLVFLFHASAAGRKGLPPCFLLILLWYTPPSMEYVSKPMSWRS